MTNKLYKGLTFTEMADRYDRLINGSKSILNSDKPNKYKLSARCKELAQQSEYTLKKLASQDSDYVWLIKRNIIKSDLCVKNEDTDYDDKYIRFFRD